MEERGSQPMTGEVSERILDRISFVMKDELINGVGKRMKKGGVELNLQNIEFPHLSTRPTDETSVGLVIHPLTLLPFSFKSYKELVRPNWQWSWHPYKPPTLLTSPDLLHSLHAALPVQ